MKNYGFTCKECGHTVHSNEKVVTANAKKAHYCRYKKTKRDTFARPSLAEHINTFFGK